MKIISISGKARSGKGYYAEQLNEYINDVLGKRSVIVNFADVLKYVCKQYYGWNGEKDEAGRTLLQQLGTEKRLKNNPKCWVKVLFNIIDLMQDDFDYVIVADTRFIAEMKALKRHYAGRVFTVRVTRYNKENGTLYESNLTNEQKHHSSETELDYYKFDYNVKNYVWTTKENDSTDEAQVIVEDLIRMMEREVL